VSFFTIAEAARLIAAKKISPVELVQTCLGKVKALDPAIHAFITLTEEAALKQAKALQKRKAKSRLHGIPIGLKDIFCTAGVRTTAHSRQLADFVPEEDAYSVKRLYDAGAIGLGKLATHEFAFGGPSFDLPWPPARNPWDPEHFTGGSSSGTAAAIAAGMVLGGTGSDTSGSIRSPAALCGIAGLKPTYGRVSRRGVLPLAFSMDHAGPMAWNAEDCALLLQEMAGHDPLDPASADVPVPDFSRGLKKPIKGIRIGVARHFFERDHEASDDTVKAIDAALHVLRRLGCKVKDVKLPALGEWHAAGLLIMLSEGYTVHEAWLKSRPERYGAMLRDRISMGAFISAADYVAALRRRRELAHAMREVMQDVDILVSAVQPGEAPKIDAVGKWHLFEAPSFAMPSSLTGAPALSVCCGFGANGLPLGIQMSARPFEEARLLRVAHAYETAAGWRERRPRLRGGD
jgi:aspartyl-tRNA(Asn)/glutamyl-tRNA(Gln) amidotransferase subunit A